MGRYIHDDIKEMMDNAAENGMTSCWTPQQLAELNTMLQYAWNRGYKGGYDDALDACAPTTAGISPEQQIEDERIELAGLNRKAMGTALTMVEHQRQKLLTEFFENYDPIGEMLRGII